MDVCTCKEGGQRKGNEGGRNHLTHVLLANLSCNRRRKNVKEGLHRVSRMRKGTFRKTIGHTTTSIIMLPLAPAKLLPPSVNTNWATTVLRRNQFCGAEVYPRAAHETKNIDTPIPPRFAKTPDEGKMIMPSCGAVRNGCVCAWSYLQERPSRTFSSAPRITAGMAVFANITRPMGSNDIR